MGIWPDTADASACPNTIAKAEEMASPRLMKTHLSLDMLPDGIMQKKAKASNND